MKPETKPEDNKTETMPAGDKTPDLNVKEHDGQNDNAGADATVAPDSSAPAGPKAYVDPSIAAEAKIAELEAQIAELRDRYVRAIAENDNLRKRTEREKSDIAKYAVSKFAADMLAIADNLRRAIAAASSAPEPEEQSGSLKAFLEGVELTDQELQKSLEKNGIRLIAANGKIFDPHKHQAVMEKEDVSVPAGTILQVFQDGYQIEDRVLRPSMVVVAKGGVKPSKLTEAEATPSELADSGAAQKTADDQPDAGVNINTPEPPQSNGAPNKPGS